MINYFSYSSQGTGFNTGISAGAFTIPGNVSRGVPINQPMFYRLSPKEAGTVVEGTQDFSATPGTEFYKIGVFNSDLANLVEYPIGNYVLMLDVPRTLTFTLTNVVGDADVTIIVNYIDQYGQIGRRQSGDFDGEESNFPVGVLGISSVEVIKNEGNTATFNVEMQTTNILELLYNDYGSPSTFMWITANSINQSINYPFFVTLSQNDPFGFKSAPDYTRALQTPQTLTSGQPRPLIDLSTTTFGTNLSFGVVQNVLGIGMSSEGATSITDPILNDNRPIPTITYSQEVIFGRKNYIEDWKGFKG